MSIFFWKNNKTYDEFALELAQDFITGFPNDAAHSVPNKKNKIKLNKTIDKLSVKATAFAKDNKLGVYSKARIGNQFMWALKEQNYDEKFIDEITKDLIATLGRK